MSAKPHGNFPTTEWTLVARLKHEDVEISRKAMDDLCAQYHYPLYCLIRLRGLAHHDAEDTLHEFLAKLLRLGAFDDLAESKGRLRTFLAKSLDRFLITHHHQENRRQKREISVSDTRFGIDPKLQQRYEYEIATTKESPDLVFDRQWCQQLLQRVLMRLKDACSGKKETLFATLHPVIVNGGSLRGHDPSAMAASLSITEVALRTALSRLLRDYRKLLVDEVRQTVALNDEVEAEIADLMYALSGERHG